MLLNLHENSVFYFIISSDEYQGILGPISMVSDRAVGLYD